MNFIRPQLRMHVCVELTASGDRVFSSGESAAHYVVGAPYACYFMPTSLSILSLRQNQQKNRLDCFIGGDIGSARPSSVVPSLVFRLSWLHLCAKMQDSALHRVVYTVLRMYCCRGQLSE